MIEELADRIWANPRFHGHREAIGGAWLQSELGLDRTLRLEEGDLVRCLQAATVLAATDDPARQNAAYSVAACAAGLALPEFPGIAGALRVVLTRLGNFPALGSADHVRDFSRLPTGPAVSEELRRDGNRIDIGDEGIVLTDFQRELWEDLAAGRNVSISAPTSAGKSFVLQTYLRDLARGGRLAVACYLVPSRALIAQVTDAVAAWRRSDDLSDFQIVNVPLQAGTPLPPRAIHVLTQERLLATMGAHPDFAADLVICDEAQGIEDGARGVLLHNVVDRLLAKRPDAQVVFAGPNIGDPGVFAKIFDLASLREVRTRSPAVLQNLIVVNTRSPTRMWSVERLTGGERQRLGEEPGGRSVPSIRERLVRVAERFGQAKPSIVYANGPADAEKVALGLAEVVADAPADERLTELVQLVKTAVHERYDLGRCLARRVGFHYGRIPAIVRRAVEAGFADGQVRFLVTTSTLMQGVNFPAANLFVCQPRKGRRDPLNPAEFWNLAGRAGRLGREFQGNVFLIDYDEWATHPAEQGNEVQVQSALKRTLGRNLPAVVDCALEANPGLETDAGVDVEAVFARLLSDATAGKVGRTLDRCGVTGPDRERLVAALDTARERIKLPAAVLAASPTVSPIRQQRLADYFEEQFRGGGRERLEQLLPRHPRDPAAYKVLCEVFLVCHRQLLTLPAPKLHMRMAAIALNWMKGMPLPAIIDDNHRRSGGTDIAKAIRETLREVEEDVRFKYFRLTICYLAVLSHVLSETGHAGYAEALPAIPTYLEVGASDLTMVSLVGLGISRVVARELTDVTMNKDMDQAAALAWLRTLDLEAVLRSKIMREEVLRALANVV